MVRMGLCCARFVVAAAVTIVAARAAAAPVIGIQIDSLGGGYAGYSASQEGTANPDGSFGLKGFVDGAVYGTAFTCDWSIVVNEDPQITSTFTLTNISSLTQTFVMTVTLPIAALGPSTLRGGYLGLAGSGTTYTDSNANGNVQFSANPFYQALVNGMPPQGLGNYNVNSSTSGTEPQESWGTPIPSAPFGPASGNMQIKWQFSLSGGDSVSTQGFFQVEKAPEPAALALIGLGLAVLVASRRLV
ncbi:MAG TPA: PEP-CTERM sorting domain-containing protein [Vicinamibacterales bacterium]|nr:PEP-CTERM sorting domain-containing protein [Vicinamibacterales bacterium]